MKKIICWIVLIFAVLLSADAFADDSVSPSLKGKWGGFGDGRSRYTGLDYSILVDMEILNATPPFSAKVVFHNPVKGDVSQTFTGEMKDGSLSFFDSSGDYWLKIGLKKNKLVGDYKWGDHGEGTLRLWKK